MSTSETKLDSKDARGIKRWLRRIRAWHAAVLWVLLMWPLAHWGLPSSRYDTYLFGGQPAWEPERYQAARALNALRERNAGADTDLDPLADRSRPIELTKDYSARFQYLVERGLAESDTRLYTSPAAEVLAQRLKTLAEFAEKWQHIDEAARGQILLRYRLYSRQPDEMITFRALQRMKPREMDLDPKMYQYGGGYIYLVGAAIGLTSALGLTRLTSDLNVYLAQPELFGAFYVIARAISLVFAAGALIAVSRLAARAAGRAGGWIALLLVAASPVFITGALEAKPHLPATCMTLWAIEFALRYWTRERTRDAMFMGLAAGYACGLVLTGVAALITIAALGIALVLRKRRISPALAAAGIAIVVYLFTNPYVVINVLANRDALTSNIKNSTAMYAMDRFGEGAFRVGALLIECIGGPTLAIGIIGCIVLIVRYSRPAMLASAAGLALMLLCAAIGAGKPPEFARFLVLPAALLCAAGGVALVEVGRRSRVIALVLLLACLVTADGRDYANSFRLDAGGTADSRSAAAAWLHEQLKPVESIGVLQEPAPYSVPPLDFATRRVILLPAAPPTSVDRAALPEWLVFSDDCALNIGPWDGWTEHYEIKWTDAFRRMKNPSPIAWANKPVFVYRRVDLNAPMSP